MENPHWVTWPSKQNTNATVAMECYHMRYNGYGGDTATWKQWIVGMKLRSGQLFADDYHTAADRGPNLQVPGFHRRPDHHMILLDTNAIVNLLPSLLARFYCIPVETRKHIQP